MIHSDKSYDIRIYKSNGWILKILSEKITRKKGKQLNLLDYLI